MCDCPDLSPPFSTKEEEGEEEEGRRKETKGRPSFEFFLFIPNPWLHSGVPLFCKQINAKEVKTDSPFSRSYLGLDVLNILLSGVGISGI